MFRFRKRYPSPSSHGLPEMQRSHQINAWYDFDVIYMDIRHCHITVITVTSHDRHGASNHRLLDGLFNNLFQASIKLKKNSAAIALYHGNQPMIGGFPSERASTTECASMPWRHHDDVMITLSLRHESELVCASHWYSSLSMYSAVYSGIGVDLSYLPPSVKHRC